MKQIRTDLLEVELPKQSISPVGVSDEVKVGKVFMQKLCDDEIEIWHPWSNCRIVAKTQDERPREHKLLFVIV